MPTFDTDQNAQTFSTGATQFHFTGTAINATTLGASEYTLVGLACDRSTSVASFASQIEGCLKSSLEGCKKSPRVNNLLARLVAFNGKVEEQHGFQLLRDCHLDKYDGFLKPGGSTALYDATVNIVDSLAVYGKELIEKDYTVNGIVVVMTDGVDYGSKLGVHEAKQSIERALKSESLESLVSVLIGINVTDSEVSQYLKRYKDDVGFTQYIEAKDASPATFAKVAGFISKSVSSQSQAVGTGAASQPIIF